ncbi:hypothetical protein I316_07886 [Kwoniella heveanensis BCC8398]|uniref:Uncharacterized protein n=1 Tax=Kwoniella heveanensis BCC8398 TaxID=1296120 RepID=A0A1B9GHD8_9TREE|nr:hypothetical protein I316_07886 [Kwoniella heveanensis BCC8398]
MEGDKTPYPVDPTRSNRQHPPQLPPPQLTASGNRRTYAAAVTGSPSRPPPKTGQQSSGTSADCLNKAPGLGSTVETAITIHSSPPEPLPSKHARTTPSSTPPRTSVKKERREASSGVEEDPDLVDMMINEAAEEEHSIQMGQMAWDEGDAERERTNIDRITSLQAQLLTAIDAVSDLASKRRTLVGLQRRIEREIEDIDEIFVLISSKGD